MKKNKVDYFYMFLFVAFLGLFAYNFIKPEEEFVYPYLFLAAGFLLRSIKQIFSIKTYYILLALITVGVIVSIFA